MGQRWGKRHAQRGVSLYKQQDYSEAIVELEKAFDREKKDTQRFTILSYLCLTHLDLGRFHDVLSCAKRQVIVSEHMHDAQFQAEAIFNMARAYERLADFRTSISWCGKSLQNNTDVSSLAGYVHLCLGNNCFGLSDSSKCLEHYDKAAHIARVLCDVVLELRVYIGLGQLFVSLMDNPTALQHYVRASEIARQFDANHPCVKYQRRVAVEMAVVYWKLGRLGEALEICEEAMKQALTHGDRIVQAKCLLNFAEIHRQRQNFQRAYPRYESAFSIAKETGDRKCQLDVLTGMAKCAQAANDMEQAVELNEKVLKLSHEIGSKMDTLQCRRRLCEVYLTLSAPDLAHVHAFHVQQLLHELNLHCGVCTEAIGEVDDKIRPLPCYHIIHERGIY